MTAGVLEGPDGGILHPAELVHQGVEGGVAVGAGEDVVEVGKGHLPPGFVQGPGVKAGNGQGSPLFRFQELGLHHPVPQPQGGAEGEGAGKFRVQVPVDYRVVGLMAPQVLHILMVGGEHPVFAGAVRPLAGQVGVVEAQDLLIFDVVVDHPGEAAGEPVPVRKEVVGVDPAAAQAEGHLLAGGAGGQVLADDQQAGAVDALRKEDVLGLVAAEAVGKELLEAELAVDLGNLGVAAEGVHQPTHLILFTIILLFF